MRKKLADDHIKIIRWLVNNTPLSGKEISSYCETHHDIKLNYDSINNIRKGKVYSDITEGTNIDSPELQRFIALCNPTTFSEGIERFTGGGYKSGYNRCCMDNGRITDKRFSYYLEARSKGLV